MPSSAPRKRAASDTPRGQSASKVQRNARSADSSPAAKSLESDLFPMPSALAEPSATTNQKKDLDSVSAPVLQPAEGKIPVLQPTEEEAPTSSPLTEPESEPEAPKIKSKPLGYALMPQRPLDAENQNPSALEPKKRPANTRSSSSSPAAKSRGSDLLPIPLAPIEPSSVPVKQKIPDPVSTPMLQPEEEEATTSSSLTDPELALPKDKPMPLIEEHQKPSGPAPKKRRANTLQVRLSKELAVLQADAQKTGMAMEQVSTVEGGAPGAIRRSGRRKRKATPPPQPEKAVAAKGPEKSAAEKEPEPEPEPQLPIAPPAEKVRKFNVADPVTFLAGEEGEEKNKKGKERESVMETKKHRKKVTLTFKAAKLQLAVPPALAAPPTPEAPPAPETQEPMAPKTVVTEKVEKKKRAPRARKKPKTAEPEAGYVKQTEDWILDEDLALIRNGSKAPHQSSSNEESAPAPPSNKTSEKILRNPTTKPTPKKKKSASTRGKGASTLGKKVSNGHTEASTDGKGVSSTDEIEEGKTIPEGQGDVSKARAPVPPAKRKRGLETKKPTIHALPSLKEPEPGDKEEDDTTPSQVLNVRGSIQKRPRVSQKSTSSKKEPLPASINVGETDEQEDGAMKLEDKKTLVKTKVPAPSRRKTQLKITYNPNALPNREKGQKPQTEVNKTTALLPAATRSGRIPKATTAAPKERTGKGIQQAVRKKLIVPVNDEQPWLGYTDAHGSRILDEYSENEDERSRKRMLWRLSRGLDAEDKTSLIADYRRLYPHRNMLDDKLKQWGRYLRKTQEQDDDCDDELMELFPDVEEASPVNANDGLPDGGLPDGSLSRSGQPKFGYWDREETEENVVEGMNE